MSKGKIELLRMSDKDIDIKQIKNATTKKRDVMVHAAVTICGTVNRIQVVGEKDFEVCQFAGDWDARNTPISETHVRHAFDEMRELCIRRMRLYGLIR